MRQALHDAGGFHGGGGAAARFHLTLLTLRVIESKLHELRRVRIDDSVFFKGIEPDKLAGETSRIADEIRTALEAMTRHNFPWNENYVATMEQGTPSLSPLQVTPAITSWRAPGTQC